MQVTLTNILQLFMAAQLSTYAMLMLRTNRLLPFTLLFLTISAHMVTNLLVDSQTISHRFDITFSFRFLYGPLLYLAVREIIRKNAKLSYLDISHAIPFVIAIPLANSHFIFDLLGILSLAAYFSLAIRLIRSVRLRSEDLLSEQGVGQIDWIKNTTIGLVLISIFDVTHSIIFKYYQIQSNLPFDQVSIIMLILLLNWFAYKAIRYPEQFEGFSTKELRQEQSFKDDTLNDEETAQIEKVITYLTSEKLYLNPNLRASDLADKLEIKQRFLSRALYIHTGMRFNSFINTLRIAKAKQLIYDTPNDKLNILAISFKAGFNSKTAFNTSFKNLTGMTPSEYKKTQT